MNIPVRINEEPLRYKNASLESFAYSEESLKNKPIIEAFANRVESMKKGNPIFLWGKDNGNGNGKSYIAYAILRKVREFNQPYWHQKKEMVMPCGSVQTMNVDFKYFVDLCKTFDEDAAPYQAALYSADYLLIDEVSINNLSTNPFEDKRQLQAVLNERIANLKPTILTSNNSPEEFAEAFGLSIYSRLQCGDFVEFPDKDMRPILKGIENV